MRKLIIISSILPFFSLQPFSVQASEASLEETAKKLSNPLSDLWLLFFQNDLTYFLYID